jgi:uncharacterized protein
VLLPDLLTPRPERDPGEPADVVRRRRGIVVVTLLAGSALLAGALATPRGSTAFQVLGVLAAATWLAGSVASGPVPVGGRYAPVAHRRRVAGPVLLGIVAFGAFAAAERGARHVPVLSEALDSVLGRAEAQHAAVVVVIALLNAVGEEAFFRGALLASLPRRRAAVVATVLYVAVTVVTLNAALVLAAGVMGTVFMLERLSTGGVLAPTLTHVTWSTLMVLALPR